MAADTAGPPPGFEGASEDGSREPPDVPPTPSLGRRGNGEPVESRTTSGSDNGSHGRHAEATAGAGEEHQHTDSSLHEWNVGKEATHHEWRTGSGAAPAEEPERGARSDGRDHGGTLYERTEVELERFYLGPLEPRRAGPLANRLERRTPRRPDEVE